MKPAIVLKRIIVGLAIAVALIYASLCGLLYAFQREVEYHPTPLHFEPDAPAIAVGGKTGTLHGWVVNPGHPNAAIHFGGNGESLEFDVEFYRELLPDTSVYLVPYRGYGPNAGVPSEAGIEADALAVFDFVRARHAHVMVIGRSLGSGVATYVAAHRPVDQLVLVTPYDSILNIARERYPVFPVALFLRDPYESWRSADSVRIPTLVLLASDDQVIPRASSDALIAHLNPKPVVVVVPHSDHNNLNHGALYAQALRDFLEPRPPSQQVPSR
jgi:pimeloyl-ACP methyl ester carboxylesterase